MKGRRIEPDDSSGPLFGFLAVACIGGSGNIAAIFTDTMDLVGPDGSSALEEGAGDGAMRFLQSECFLEINHCFEQRAYVDWKYRHLFDPVRTPPKPDR